MNSVKIKPSIVKLLVASLFVISNSHFASAADITINSGEFPTTTQTLTSNGDTGIVNSGGSITVSGGNGFASTRDHLTIINNGTITTTTSGDSINLNGSEDISITNNATINAADDGIDVTSGEGYVIINTGSITGANSGIELGGTSDVVITNSGSISGAADYGIDLSNDSNITVNNNVGGSITSSSGGGITSGGESVTINNYGTITSSNEGIYSEGGGLTVNNYGTISSDNGIEIDDDSFGAVILNNGTINANDGEGVDSNGGKATITNNGTINSTGDGIDAEESKSVVINNGTINSTGGGSNGIEANGSASSVTNNGVITSRGKGIGSDGRESTIINNGFITSNSSDDDSDDAAIYVEGLNSTVINNGSLFTSNGEGIKINEDGITVINNGSITVTGDNHDGIYDSGGSNITITNNGSIINTGAGSDGISSSSDNISITNSGSISVSGTGAKAVDLEGAGQTFTNTGTISATGNADKAIVGVAGTQNVILGKGSQIIGSIDLGAGTDNVTITGNGISSRITTTNVENLSLAAGVSGVVINNNVAHVIDPTSVSMLNLGVNSLNNNIHGIVGSHVNGLEKDRVYKDKKDSTWMQTFGGQFERGQESNNFAFSHNNYGVIGGLDKKSDNNSGYGMFFGFSAGNFETDQRSFDGKVSSFFTGAYKYFNFSKATTLSANLVAGYEKYETKRHLTDNLSGKQTANSDFGNIFISPSLNLEHKIKFGKRFELRPNARINYVGSFFDDHKEGGAGDASISYESRKLHALNSRAGLTGVVKFQNYELSLGGGLDSRIINAGNAKAKVAGSKFSLRSYSKTRVNGGYVNVGAKILDIKGLTFSANLEMRQASGDENQNLGNLNVLYRF